MPESELIRPYIDANVLFSVTHKPDSRFLQIWAMTGVVPTTSPYAIEEVRNSFRKNRSRPEQERRFAILLRWCVVVEDPVRDPIPPGIALAKKDRPILAAAIASGCNYLLTSDKHDFSGLYKRTIAGVYVMHTQAFRFAFQYRVDLDMLAYNFSEATGW